MHTTTTLGLRHLSEAEVRDRLDVSRLIAALEEAFRSRYPHVALPPRGHVELGGHGVVLLMPCYDPSCDSAGVKVATVAAESSEHGRVHAYYLLLDGRTGVARAHLEANYLTDVRTASVSAIATRHLARSDATVLAVFGTGRLARAHVQVFARVFELERILVCGSDSGKAEAFSEQMSAQIGRTIRVASPDSCAREADILCTCTTSRSPLFDPRAVRPGTHLNLVGAFQPASQEAHEDVIQRARVFVDTYAGAMSEAGDLLVPMARGLIGREHVVGDLHELVSGKKAGRSSMQEVTVFKSVGCALEDLVAAELLCNQS